MLGDVNSSNGNKLILKNSEAVDCKTRKKSHILFFMTNCLKLMSTILLENYLMTSKINDKLSY